MSPIRSGGLLVALAALTGPAAWSIEPDDPTVGGNLPIPSTSEPFASSRRRPASPMLPQVKASPFSRSALSLYAQPGPFVSTPPRPAPPVAADEPGPPAAAPIVLEVRAAEEPNVPAPPVAPAPASVAPAAADGPDDVDCPQCRASGRSAPSSGREEASDEPDDVDCPQCRALGRSAPSSGRKEGSKVDVDVQQVQVPSTIVPPRPRTPAAPPSPTPGTPPTTPPGPGTTAATAPPGGTAAAPRATTPGAPSAAEEFARISASSPAGGEAGARRNLGFSVAPVMLGDQPPLSVRQTLIPVTPSPPPRPTPPQPPTPPVPNPARARGAVLVPWVRGFKIADNQSPRPQDRFFFTFDFFEDLNGSINRRMGAAVSHEKVYRELFGLEKTFFDGNASIGLRVPVNTLVADSMVRGLGGTSTAFGNLTAFAKLILWQDEGGRNLISGGLSVTTPNSPTRFAGSPSAIGFHDAQIQPFLGYIFAGERWYFQGFEAIDVPTDPHDVTMLYNDLGLGYFIYRSRDPGALVSAIAPTFETHVNVPLNHRGAFRFNDRAGAADVVDLTYGVNVLLQRRALLTVGFVNPVTGPKPFSYEWQLLLNWYFGRTRARAFQVAPVPPIGGS